MASSFPSPPEPLRTSAFWRKRSVKQEVLLFMAWVLGLALVSWAFQVMTKDTIWAFVTDAPRQVQDVGARMLPPDWGFAREIVQPMWETLNIATLGTLLGMALALPVAFLAARNTTPSVRFVRPLALLVIVGSRSINSLIWALLLVAILGPGVLAGIISIALRSIGFIGKLMYEAIEEIDAKQVEAIESTGASRVQVMAWAIAPQTAPTLAGVSLFRWDINIRESTVLGLVGAGGIGVKLEAALGTLAWPKVTLILLAILATVVLSEWLTAKVRKKLI
ncbi:phosphonate ABC transporter, permease protein PhnE [Lampropedia puyangensis]|uniref:Phosphonate ABC transporter, permease protein PhnE n=2 Tax=Lampropedia puyangensis TaxID=1330072 RepID=A0A4S8F6A9_9BURK|nr:phosphonate ABC transporter, permease protein PhnE [Lampropedia puyangensis]